jgi:hypothetical protein
VRREENVLYCDGLGARMPLFFSPQLHRFVPKNAKEASTLGLFIKSRHTSPGSAAMIIM